MNQYKLILSVFLSSLCLIVPFTQATDVRYCDKKGNYLVKVKGVEITPNPVVSGQKAKFSISASTDKAISGGKVDIGVSYFGFHVHSETHDLCDETSCPIDGNFVLSHSQTLPGFTPPGRYSLTMKMYDGEKEELTCIEFDFRIGFASSSVADS